MKATLRLLLVGVLLFGGQALALKVVLVSSDNSPTPAVQEKAKESRVQKMNASKDQQEAEKREKLLKELQELYKQGNHPAE